MRREIWTGIRYVGGRPWLWVTITLFAFVLMFQWAPIQVLTPKLVRDHFHLSVRAYGFIFSALGAGMIIGAVTFAQLNLRRRRGLISYLIWMLNSLLIVLFALSPWYWLAVLAAFLRGACIGFGVAVWETMLMELVPQHMLSRVVSLDWFGALGLTPFGLIAAGAASSLASPGTIIAFGACISLSLVAFGLLSRRIRADQGLEDEPARLLEAEVRHEELPPPCLGEAGRKAGGGLEKAQANSSSRTPAQALQALTCPRSGCGAAW